MFVIGLFQDSNSVIWARLNKNILSYDGRSWTNHNRVQGGYQLGGKAHIHEGLDGTLWFADWSLESFKDGTWRIPSSPPHGWSTNLTTTSDGRLWAWGGAGASWWSVKDDAWVSAVETSSWVYGFIEKPKGRYWLGLWNGGTVYFDGSQSIDIPLKAKSRVSFFEGDEGELWAVGDAIYKWQAKGGRDHTALRRVS